jgi:hypothetical protein
MTAETAKIVDRLNAVRARLHVSALACAYIDADDIASLLYEMEQELESISHTIEAVTKPAKQPATLETSGGLSNCGTAQQSKPTGRLHDGIGLKSI